MPLIMIVWRSRLMIRRARWAMRLTSVLFLLAIGGVQIRCDRDLKITALVDFSASTRGAHFRDPSQLKKRLAELAPGRQTEVRYFANRFLDEPHEGIGEQTTLPQIDADAVILFSDGIFQSPNQLPPTYAVIDRGLEQVIDARVFGFGTSGNFPAVITTGKLENRSLNIDGAMPNKIAANDLSGLTVILPTTSLVRATLNRDDLWPENDTLSMIHEPNSEKPLVVKATQDLPDSIGQYSQFSAIILPASIRADQRREQLLQQYTHLLGGSLILVGNPGEFGPTLRQIAPLSSNPPKSKSRWIFLLDSSGSMAEGLRWANAIDATINAISQIDADAVITISRFSREMQTLANDVSSAKAIETLQSMRMTSPSGPTGLGGAIESVAGGASAESNLVVITDADAVLPNVDQLIVKLLQSKLRLFVLNAISKSPNEQLDKLCLASGGAQIQDGDPSHWTQSVVQLVRQAGSSTPVKTDTPIQLIGSMSGISLRPRTVFPSFLRESAEVLAKLDDKPIAAAWQAGTGRVLSVAADIETDTIDQIVSRFESEPSDPRFRIVIDDQNDVIRIHANDNAQPINALRLEMDRIAGDQTTKKSFDQIAPGEYQAAIQRLVEPSIVIVRDENRVLKRIAIAGRYPREFDAIGNDREALKKLANDTGGELIEPDRTAPIGFKNATAQRTFTPHLAAAAALAGIACAFATKTKT